MPREPWRRPDGRLEPALAAVILDEIAWWLGALVSQEGGLTNRIDLVIRRPDTVVSGPLLATGRFDAVVPVDRRRTFWRPSSRARADDQQQRPKETASYTHALLRLAAPKRCVNREAPALRA